MSFRGDFGGTERFEIQRRLGAGGMGVVYQAYDREKHTTVALKTLREHDAAALYRFKREFRGLADISHPNLATLHELVSVGDQWFFTMELVDGVDFLAHVRDEPPSEERLLAGDADTLAAGEVIYDAHDSQRHHWSGHRSDPVQQRDIDESAPPASPPPDIERLRRALRQLAEGVHALHAAGKLHRDIKPSNVLVTRSGRVVLLDFGLVTELERPAGARTTDQNNLVGTAAYMSPEQGASMPVSPASDWYSVGVILYQALTGRLPFDGPPLAVLMDKQTSDPPRPSELIEGIPADLDQLCVQLLSREPAGRPGGARILRTLGSNAAGSQRHLSTSPSPDLPFIGRQRHLDALADAFATSRRGHPVAVFAHGVSGMGKSALVERFTRQLARDDRAVVLSGRCYERESVPYKALDALIDSLSRLLVKLPPHEAEALLPRDARAIARLFPVLRRVDAVANAPKRGEVGDPHELRRRGLAALRELLARLADRTPLVLVIDDLQWGDVDSASLLIDLMSPPDAPAVLLVACYRSDEVADSEALGFLLERIDAAGEDIERRELVVDALNDDEARDLALALLGRHAADASAHARAIATEAGGNPFFVYELVRYLQTGADGHDESAVRDATDVGRRKLRPVEAVDLDEVISARVEQLPDEARRLLESVAVAGRPIKQTVACRAAAVGDESSALAVLRAGHLVRTSGARGKDRIETYHDRIRETVARALSGARLAEQHARLARALEAEGDADPEALAQHFFAAGKVEEAGEHAALAADQATEALAFERAARLYERAIEYLPVTTAARLRLRVKLGDALANAGRGARAATEYLHAAEGASAAEALEMKRRAADQLLRSGYVDEGLAALRAVLSVVGMRMASTPRRALASLIARRAQIRLRGLGYSERDTSQIAAEELTRIDICWSIATGLGTIDTIHGADFQTRHLLLALRAGEPYRVARALALEAMFLSTAGQPTWKRTHALLQRAEEIAHRIDNPHAQGLALLASGLVEYQAGNYRRAVDDFERSAELLRARCTGVTFEISAAQRFAIDSLFNMGELREVTMRVPAQLRDAERRGDIYAATEMRTGLPNGAWLIADDPVGARRATENGIAHWSQHGFHLQHYYHALALCNIDLYEGDAAAAHQRFVEIWRDLERTMIMRIQTIRLESTFARARAAVAAGGSLHADAERLARALEDEPVKAGPPMAALIDAAVIHRAGDGEGARRLLARAMRGFEAANMALLACLCRRRRGQLGDAPEDREAVDLADEWMRSQNVRNPERLAAVFAPGFDG